jgi:signal transduction histidine kinase
MKRRTASVGGHSAAFLTDNHIMTGSAQSLRRVLNAPLTKHAWAELWYTLVTVPLALAAVAFTVAGLGNGLLWAASAPGLRKFGAASRFLARGLLSEDVPAPPRLQPLERVRVRTPNAGPLARVAVAAGGRARPWETKQGVTVSHLPVSRIAELAAKEEISVLEMRPTPAWLRWIGAALRDKAAWRARGYFALKLPLAVGGLLVAAGSLLGGVVLKSLPAWWTLGLHEGVDLAGSFLPLPLGAVLLLAGPWLTHGVAEADRRLIRSLLGPSSWAERIRALEESRARAVDDPAARLRSIERDLHDGTQAQLVALAMKLGLAREKLTGSVPVDLPRVTQLVGDAHRSALEAIADLRTLARGIHPPVLDNGLADALATLAARSAVLGTRAPRCSRPWTGWMRSPAWAGRPPLR